jgi:hypothetical protein
MFYVCECGDKFDVLGDEAEEHVIDQHLDLVENAFADLLDQDDSTFEETGVSRGEEQLWEDAIDDVIGELMDELPDDHNEI